MITRDLLSGPVTLSAARANSRNVLQALGYPRQRDDFYQRIEGHRALLADVVAHHLGASPSDILISTQEYWRHGSFNLCIPVRVNCEDLAVPIASPFVMLRFPLPYRVGEKPNPGNCDEKVNCEAATYAWIRQDCPSVPIPRLYGFGLSSNQRFTSLELLPWWSRWYQMARCYFLATLGFQHPSHYVSHNLGYRPTDLDIGYLIIETITDGEMLSETWEENNADKRLQENLQRDLAKIMLSLASKPLERIGTFRLDDKGYIRLANRPLSVQWTIQENEGISVDVSRDTTFSNVKDYILHYLTTLDNRLLHQENAISNRDDAWYQMTSLAAAKVTYPQLFEDKLSSGPFTFAFTDLHQSNIIVDEDWHITCIIDLEFSCSWPIELLQPPYWLGNKLVDEIDPAGFGPTHNGFIEHVKREEQLQNGANTAEPLSTIMQRAWTGGAFWAAMSLIDPIGFTAVFYNRILPDFFSITIDDQDKADYKFFAHLWRPNVHDIVEKKMNDLGVYSEQLNVEFRQGASIMSAR